MPPTPPPPAPNGKSVTVTTLEARTFRSIKNGKPSSPNNTILMGSYVTVLPDDPAIPQFEGYKYVEAFGIQGYLAEECLAPGVFLKIFFVDVGQGDGALIEVINSVANGQDRTLRYLIDGGDNTQNMARYLAGWHFKGWYERTGKKPHFDAIFVSHFDADHFDGLTPIIADPDYTIGTIYHAGLVKFTKRKGNQSVTRLTIEDIGNNIPFVTDYIDDAASLVKLKDEQPELQKAIRNFTLAVEDALKTERLGGLERLDATVGKIISKKPGGKTFSIEVLGPVTTAVEGGGVGFKMLQKNAGKTINGHSLVLKVTFGERTILFGGDLNTASERHLMDYYGVNHPFEVDVAKSCHHGSGDFTEDFMALINPFATIISSGDNEGHAHPRADAVGCAGKYARNKRPLVFSTELARSTDLKAGKTIYGMINLRSDGDKLLFAQMKEAQDKADVWDSYELSDFVS